MDGTTKPTKPNPRACVGCLSQLLFIWAIPLLYRGSTKGLYIDDVTKCLEKDNSDVLGDRLEKKWYQEVDAARNKNRKPQLKRALMKTFWPSTVADGFANFVFIMFKSLIPAVLAQLLLRLTHSGTDQSLDADGKEIVSSLNTSLQRTVRDIQAHNGDNVLAQFVADSGNAAAINSLEPSNGSHLRGIEMHAASDSIVLDTAFSDLAVALWMNIYFLATVICLSTVFCCFLIHHVDLRQRMMGARMRIACCSLIYRKTLRLSMTTAGRTQAGYVINLLSNDVNRLDYGFLFIHMIWILPFQAVLIAYLIWTQIGLAALVGVLGLLLKTVPVQTGLSKLSSRLRMKIAERSDARIGIMSELVQGIQVIKMYAWEKPFAAVVSEARRREIKQIRYASYLRGFYLSTMVITERSTLYIVIAAVLFMGGKISADIVFALAGYFNILQLVAAIWYPLAVSFGAESLVSLRRVQTYLLMDNKDESTDGIAYKRIPMNANVDEDETQPPQAMDTIQLQYVSAKWVPTKRQYTLEDFHLNVGRGKLCAVIGPVGGGKSSLLQLLLGELPAAEGTVIVHGDISYAAQEPWLFSGTVRHNILFGEPYDGMRYLEVSTCCALSTDFQQLPNGDKSLVGARGASLSGGQRARVSLARAVYKKADIYLLDDPLSAVDAHVGRHLFDEVIGPKGRLANENATRILVTHQVHFVAEADWIVIIENGRIAHQGTYDELAISDENFAKMMERPRVSIVEMDDSAADLQLEDDADESIPFMDGSREGGYTSLRRNTLRETSPGFKSINSDKDVMMGKEGGPGEDQMQGVVSSSIWSEYFRAGSSILGLSFMVFVMLLSQIICSGLDYFINIWTHEEYMRYMGAPTRLSTNECLYICGALLIGVIVMSFFRGYLFFRTCMHASKTLHDRMFVSILNTTMNFFNTNPSGRILNRFSKDMGALDEYLPRSTMDFIQIALVMCGILVVICVVNPWLLLAVLIAALIDSLIVKLYLRPSQDLKRLEAMCRSPIFSHLTATLSGLATIRSRSMQPIVAKEFDSLQNVHSGTWQLMQSSNSALGLWLDCVSCAFVTAVTFSLIALAGDTYSGNAGLAISQAMILTGMVQYGVKQVAEALQMMISAQRIMDYTDLEHESTVTRLPPHTWPPQGRIVFKNMSLRYDPNGPATLRNLNITIEPTWKVGIVGRTGAGKSSLIAALFRLANIEGGIYIDRIETGTISLESLRSHVSIIPQDPVLFSATIRHNLDPFEKYTDDELWQALEGVELKTAIPGLDYLVTESGSNFSVGQRQLICLARALVRKNKILVLDEATANVDPQTDALIQRTIRGKFNQCTVLTIAHRLHTVMDSDRILVMDAGYAKEFDIPYLLLKNAHGALRDMVEATGADAESLKRIAADSYHIRKAQEFSNEKKSE